MLIVEANALNATAESRRVRSYRETGELLGITLEAALTIEMSETGLYLIHTDGKGEPHCYGMIITATTTTILHMGKKKDALANTKPKCIYLIIYRFVCR